VLRARLEELGAAVVEAPVIRIEPLPFDPPDMASFDVLVLTSANGVERVLPADVRALAGVTVAAIGAATSEALAARGIVADVVPERAVGEALLEELGDVSGKRVLVAAAEGARDVVPEGLAAGGAEVTVLRTYRTVPEPVDAAEVLAADLVTFTSSSTVANLIAALDGAGISRLRAVSIGPVTSASLREAGIEPVAEADPHDVSGLVRAVVEAAGRVPAW
jgi:uroporphyrinogen III methyltransferase/synthase